jgi:hypothetical protein
MKVVNEYLILNKSKPVFFLTLDGLFFYISNSAGTLTVEP